MSIKLQENIGGELEKYVVALLRYIDHSDFKSYDYVDWWATRRGQQAKQLAYRTEPIGHLLFSLPILALEWWLPFMRKPLGIRKRVAPIVVAHHGLACLELFRKNKDEVWLQSAKDDAERLIGLALSDAKGLCWGFPFSWSTNKGVFPANLPAATQTAYAFDLFERLWLITHEDVYWERMLSIAHAMNEEYIDISRPEGLANSYLGRGYGDVVINAITYRIHILVRAIAYGMEHLKPKVTGLVNYLLAQQLSDGGWLYGESAKNQFIDHYHTCFVIKNLYRANQVLESTEISSALERGITFYWDNLFYANGLPQPFFRAPRMNVIKYDSYDFAECLGLFALLGEKLGFTRQRLRIALNGLLNLFWLSENRLRYRIYKLPTLKGYSYYRGSMGPTLLSLSMLLNSPIIKSTG